jgi:hypothetical protein
LALSGIHRMLRILGNKHVQIVLEILSQYCDPLTLHILLTSNDTTDCGIFSIKTTRNFRKQLELLALGVMMKR